jgi:hypothetical protein
LRSVVFENDRLRISHAPGNSEGGDVVVAFAGVGHALQGVAHEEFARTLREPHAVKEAYFVVDKDRSWYNATADDILTELGPRLDGRRVLLLGNSMGGFGAILFSGLLPQSQTVLSFSPQFSVRRQIAPFETRWQEYIDSIRNWQFDTCVSSPSNPAAKYVFFGVGDRRDAGHAELLRQVGDPSIHILLLPEAGHGAIRHLRDVALLPRLVDEGLNGSLTIDVVRSLLAEHGVTATIMD